GKRVQLRLHMSAPAVKPTSFALEKPARISLDLPNTTLSLPSRRIDVAAGGVDNIIAAESSGRARVVVALNDPMPYETRIEGDDIVVLVGAGAEGGAEAHSTSAGAKAAAVVAATASGGRNIDNLDFRRSPTGAGQLVVQLSDPHTPIDLKQQGSQIVID